MNALLSRAFDGPEGPFRAQVGFEMAVTLISFAWCMNWQHYIRYWIRSAPPYRRRTILMMRGFFTLAMLGSVIRLARDIAANHPRFQDLGYSLLVSIPTIIIFFALDAFFRWQMGPPKNPPM
jgi:hypothetical protein